MSTIRVAPGAPRSKALRSLTAVLHVWRLAWQFWKLTFMHWPLANDRVSDTARR